MEIVKFGHEVLHRPTKPVEDIDEEVRPFLADMFKTMTMVDGIGLAANQVGVPKSFFIYLGDELTGVVINPRITHMSGTMVTQEGCLSDNGRSIILRRPEVVVVEFTALDGNTYTKMFSKRLASLFCHEIDHLNGLTIVDRSKRK